LVCNFFPKIHLERHTTPTPSEVTTLHTPPDIEALPLAVQLLILKQAWIAVKAGRSRAIDMWSDLYKHIIYDVNKCKVSIDHILVGGFNPSEKY